jgi:SAM-dependent methyltransferase
MRAGPFDAAKSTRSSRRGLGDPPREPACIARDARRARAEAAASAARALLGISAHEEHSSILEARARFDWDRLYATEREDDLPWTEHALDADIERALARLPLRALRIADIGAGLGTQAAALAARGHSVTAFDGSRVAIAGARERCSGLDVKLCVGDVTRWTERERYDLAIDRGCFHELAPHERPLYVDAVARALVGGGWLILKCFRDGRRVPLGSRGVGVDELWRCFARSFVVLAIDGALFAGRDDERYDARLCTLRRRDRIAPRSGDREV